MIFKQSSHSRIPRMEKGFTLLEAMISLLVLSIGLLGIAALQYTSIQSAHSAYQRTVASIIAMDAEERVWLDLADANLDINAVQTAWNTHWTSSDVTLPGFQGTIQLEDQGTTDPADDFYKITVTWNEERFEDETDADAGITGKQSSFDYYVNFFPSVP